ncbi:MAG TPA: holo-ACP synthase [Candidatus Brocadiales bacterium]|nr:holo-ACP synthase [Candidatus Brocadiales bacterium]
MPKADSPWRTTFCFLQNKLKMYIGIDIVEIKRIQDFFSAHSGFLRRIYTEKEVAYCQQMRRNQYQHFAARFATKEAVFKALGTGWRGKMKWTDIEVLNDKLGKPYLNFYGAVKEAVEDKNVKNVAVSLSHCKDYAISEVLLIPNAEYGVRKAKGKNR